MTTPCTQQNSFLSNVWEGAKSVTKPLANPKTLAMGIFAQLVTTANGATISCDTLSTKLCRIIELDKLNCIEELTRFEDGNNITLSQITNTCTDHAVNLKNQIFENVFDHYCTGDWDYGDCEGDAANNGSLMLSPNMLLISAVTIYALYKTYR